MSIQTAVLALVLQPLIYSLPLNWIPLFRNLHRGLTPAAPEAQARAQEAEHAAVAIKHVVLMTVIVALLRGSAIPAEKVGLTLHNWRSALSLGAFCSLALMLVFRGQRRFPAATEARPGPVTRGAIAVALCVQVLGSASAELWRAFCIVGLEAYSGAAWIAVLITAFAAAVLLLSRNVGRAVGATAYGLIAGFLFVRTGTLVAPISMAVIGRAGQLYLYRRAPTKLDPLSLKCPACGHLTPRAQVDRQGRFICAGCQARLALRPPGWTPWVGGALGFLFTIYLLHVRLLYAFLLSGPILLVFGFVSLFIVLIFFPDLRTVQMDRQKDPFGKRLLRL